MSSKNCQQNIKTAYNPDRPYGAHKSMVSVLFTDLDFGLKI